MTPRFNLWLTEREQSSQPAIPVFFNYGYVLSLGRRMCYKPKFDKHTSSQNNVSLYIEQGNSFFKWKSPLEIFFKYVILGHRLAQNHLGSFLKEIRGHLWFTAGHLRTPATQTPAPWILCFSQDLTSCCLGLFFFLTGDFCECSVVFLDLLTSEHTPGLLRDTH